MKEINIYFIGFVFLADGAGWQHYHFCIRRNIYDDV